MFIIEMFLITKLIAQFHSLSEVMPFQLLPGLIQSLLDFHQSSRPAY